MDYSIKISGLGKKYRRGESRQLSNNARESFSRFVGSLLLGGKTSGNSVRENNLETEEFWAVQDIDMEIKKGEVVGIVGRNGAGKSTLLKILSRITQPTKGEIRYQGRVASLLEVGTGFHRELTGRENIFLNGSILGMRRYEILGKFDRIVEFANIGDFIDTPVKHYSSGMYVRLAFAVAAHLEPDILLIDEVLAVGDVGFQKKCLGKMEEVGKSGRTILFVSHNMPSVQRLCSRAVFLVDGKVVEDGPVGHVTSAYLQWGAHHTGEKKWDDITRAPGNEVVRFSRIRIHDQNDKIATEFHVTDPVFIELEFWVLLKGYRLDAGLNFYNEYGVQLFATMDNLDSPWKDVERPTGLHRVTCCIPGNFLNEGRITVSAGVSTNPDKSHAVEPEVISFQVLDDMRPVGVRGNYTREWPNVVMRPRLKWAGEILKV